MAPATKLHGLNGRAPGRVVDRSGREVPRPMRRNPALAGHAPKPNEQNEAQAEQKSDAAENAQAVRGDEDITTAAA
jgi:hypothetical protein